LNEEEKKRAYRDELARMDEMCRKFRAAYRKDDASSMFFQIGQMYAQAQIIYAIERAP